jgi:hypothetical protein
MKEEGKEMPSPVSLAFGFMVSILCVAGTLIFLRNAVQSVAFDIASEEIAGDLRSEYIKHTTRRSFVWFSTYDVRYSYTVNGVRYDGKHTLWFEPKLRHLPVYYSVKNPANSRLSRGMYFEESVFALLSFGMAWLFGRMFFKEVRLLRDS